MGKRVPPQPPLGKRRTDSQGRTWRKVRVVPRGAYVKAMWDAEFNLRFNCATDRMYQALGYELVKGDP